MNRYIEGPPDSDDWTGEDDPDTVDEGSPVPDPTPPVDEQEPGAEAALGAPYDLALSNAPEGGWALLIQWEYSFRYSEVDQFKVNRVTRSGATEMIKDGLANDVRTYTDVVPDTQEYTYTITAVLKDGGGEHTSEPPMVNDPDTGQQVVDYKSADVANTKPRNIRKPLRSTRQKMFVTWDYHPQASSYLLEAIDGSGNPYMTVYVTDVFAPFGLFIGDHPNSTLVTVRVSIMRRHPNGSEYVGSSATEELVIDDHPQPHWGVVDFYGQSSTVTRDLAFGAVIALAEYGTEDRPIAVNGVEYYEPWIDHDGHKHATIEYCIPNATGVTASMKIEAPDNFSGS